MALRIPHPSTALHLYRHLLREASYLPPVCRPFASDRIRFLFRANRPDRKRQAMHERRGHRGLRLLRAANAGDVLRMTRVLRLCFGRTGSQRRKLMDQFVRLEPPTDSDAAIAANAAAPSAEPKDWLVGWDTAKVRALAASQQLAPHMHLSPRRPVKTTHPAKTVPALNSWGRPWVPGLARSKLRKAYRRLADRLLPPVSHGEWDLLRDLATGVAGPEKWAIPPRRAVAQSESPTPGQDAWDWAAYVEKPVRFVQRPNSRGQQLLAGTADDGPMPTSALNRHNYRPRFWRRLYTVMWHLTATVDKKPDGRGWNIKWGNSCPGLNLEASRGYDEFFEGALVPGETKGTKNKANKIGPSKRSSVDGMRPGNIQRPAPIG